MEQTKERHWRRWVVLALMILGFFLAYFVGGIFTPVMPFISVAPEKILLEPIVPNFLGTGPLYLTNTLTTLIVTLILIFILAFFTNRSLKNSQGTDLVPRGVGNAMILPDGRYRHSVFYSILDSEWPQVKQRLEQMLER